MANFPITPRPVNLGGGQDIVNGYRGGITAAIPNPYHWISYKLKVDGSGNIGATPLAAALTQGIVLPTAFTKRPFPENVWIDTVEVNLIEEFAGGTIATATLQVGDAGDVDEWTTALNIFTGATLGRARDVSGAASSLLRGQFEAAYIPVATLTTTVGNLDALETGELDIHFRIAASIPDLPAFYTAA